MQCDKTHLILLSGHMDGTNSEVEEKRLQQHLKSCKHCRELLEAMEQNDALLSQSTAQPPANLTARIMDAVHKEPKKSKNRKRFYFSTAAAGLAVAAMLCFALLGDSIPLLPKAENDAGAELTIHDLIDAENAAPEKSNHIEDPFFFGDEEHTDTALEDNSVNTIDTFPTESTTPSPSSEKSPEATLPPETVQSSDVAPSVQPSESQAVPPSTEDGSAEHGNSDEPQESFTLPSLDGKTTDSYQSGDSPDYGGGPFNRNPLPGKTTQNTPVPTLVIWDASAQELKLPFGAVKTDFPVHTRSSTKTSLYDHFATSLFTLRQATLNGTNNNRFLAASFEFAIYTVTYDDLCNLFDSCVGKYELAIYLPEDTTDLSQCQIILIDSPQSTEKTSGKAATE